jgi:hypothetical protein
MLKDSRDRRFISQSDGRITFALQGQTFQSRSDGYRNFMLYMKRFLLVFAAVGGVIAAVAAPTAQRAIAQVTPMPTASSSPTPFPTISPMPTITPMPPPTPLPTATPG